MIRFSEHGGIWPKVELDDPGGISNLNDSIILVCPLLERLGKRGSLKVLSSTSFKKFIIFGELTPASSQMPPPQPLTHSLWL